MNWHKRCEPWGLVTSELQRFGGTENCYHPRLKAAKLHPLVGGASQPASLANSLPAHKSYLKAQKNARARL
eukprot:1160400-Pelagomonas_calceolata.AAC.3